MNAQKFLNAIVILKIKGPIGKYRLIFEPRSSVIQEAIDVIIECAYRHLRFSMRYKSDDADRLNVSQIVEAFMFKLNETIKKRNI